MKVKVYVRLRERSRGSSWEMFWTDPETGRRRSMVAKEAKGRRDAERKAAALERRINSGTYVADCSWEYFRKRFTEEELIKKSKRTRQSYESALNVFHREMGVRKLGLINASMISRFQAKMWKRVKPATLASVLRHIKGALNWAVMVGLIENPPKIRMPKVVKAAKGRALTDAEVAWFFWCCLVFEIENDYRGLTRFVRGLLTSGMRLGELSNLHWEVAPVRLDLHSFKYPAVDWSGEGQKSKRAEVCPVTPQFFEIVNVPENERKGFVFQVTGRNESILPPERIGKLIAKVGEASGIQTPAGFVTAHDFRRTFGTTMALQLKPLELKTIMRHANIATTLAYYVDQKMEELGASLWSDSARVHQKVH